MTILHDTHQNNLKQTEEGCRIKFPFLYGKEKINKIITWSRETIVGEQMFIIINIINK